jgi:hypothetical protein
MNNRRSPNAQLIAFYDCRMPFHSAFDLGMLFFAKSKLAPNDATVSVAVPVTSNAVGFNRFKSANGLSKWLDRDDLESISIGHFGENDECHLLLTFSRGSLTQGFYVLYLQYQPELAPQIGVLEIQELATRINHETRVRYGIGCKFPAEQVQAPHYVDAQTLFLPFLPYEDENLWKVEVPSYLSDAPSPRRYLDGMFRLVYQYNFITAKHLDRQIAGVSLKDWIAADRSRGTLTQLAADLWFWQVDEDHLFDVNRACAHAELLIAWKPPAIQEEKPKKRLPG